MGPGSHGGVSCTGCSQTGFYTTCANFRVNCGSSGCSVWSIQKVQSFKLR